MPEKRRANRGFTLAEALFAVSILAVAVLAIVQAITAGHVQGREALHSARATTLAESLTERVLALPYSDPDFPASPPPHSGPPPAVGPGPDPGEKGPADFDNADDYDGYTEDPGELTDASGDPYAEAYQSFHREVSASYGSLDVPGLGGSRPGLHITVTVRDGQGRAWRIRRFIPEPTEGE